MSTTAHRPTRHPDFIGGPTGPGRAAPGPGGYVLAVLVADLLTTLTITLALAAGSGSVSDLPLVLFGSAVIVLVISVPVAMVCVPVVHLLSRRHRDQWWHVAATGLVTLAVAVAGGCAMGDLEIVVALAPVALATSFGRAALVPAVRRAQHDFARGRALR